MSGYASRTARLLVVDDEATQREMLSAILGRAGFEVVTASNGEQALQRLDGELFDLLLTDQRMPDMDGLALLERARASYPTMPVVLMTAYGSVSAAVDAMKLGAADYLTKPFEKDELVLVLQKALRQRQLEAEVVALRGALKGRYRMGGMIGSSPGMLEVFSLIERVAGSDVPVLIQGESGTGKELVARAVHEYSPRAEGPFVALNCAAVPEGLLESEFFGHEKGAFTGAHRTQVGRFEQARGGTLFLDEIGAMRIDLQAKLLRALQEKEIQRLGANRPTGVDVRVLAASCENLEQAIRARTFREDLFYRLCVVPIHLPPLRERPDDIPLLVDHFLSSAAARFGREPAPLPAPVLDRLLAYPWPGNVRELENCIERILVLCRSGQVTLNDLPPAVRDGVAAGASDSELPLPARGVRLAEVERGLIQQALERSRGRLGPAAQLLGISYKTLQYRIRKHGLERHTLDPVRPADRESDGG